MSTLNPFPGEILGFEKADRDGAFPRDKVGAKSPAWADSPLTRCAAASLPLLIEAHGKLHGVAAPQASHLSQQIANLLWELIEVAGSVEAYGNKWADGDIGELARKIREATAEFNRI